MNSKTLTSVPPIINAVGPVNVCVIKREFSDLVSASLKTHPSHGISHEIHTEGKPLFSKFRRVTPEKLKVIQSYISDMVGQGILRPSSSEWASPLHLVKKVEGSWRPCGDYRLLNGVSTPSRNPIPHIQDLLSVDSG